MAHRVHEKIFWLLECPNFTNCFCSLTWTFSRLFQCLWKRLPTSSLPGWWPLCSHSVTTQTTSRTCVVHCKESDKSSYPHLIEDSQWLLEYFALSLYQHLLKPVRKSFKHPIKLFWGWTKSSIGILHRNSCGCTLMNHRLKAYHWPLWLSDRLEFRLRLSGVWSGLLCVIRYGYSPKSAKFHDDLLRPCRLWVHQGKLYFYI